VAKVVSNSTVKTSCARWHDAVLDQIPAALFRYPYHLDDEQFVK
jgi:hypothetical protein